MGLGREGHPAVFKRSSCAMRHLSRTALPQCHLKAEEGVRLAHNAKADAQTDATTDAASETQKHPTEDGGAQYSLDLYTQHQIDNWRLSKKIVVYESDAQLLQFVQDARTDSSFVKKMYFGVVGEDLAKRIKRDTGIETKGLNVTLRADNVRKIFRDHGTEQTEAPRGQRSITSSDFVKIPEVIGSPESIEKGRYLGKEAITFQKTIDQSRVTVFAVNSGTSSLDLYVQTMYAGREKGSLATTADVKSPALTSETVSGTASTVIIRNSSQKSNPQSSEDSSGDDSVQHSLPAISKEVADAVFEEMPDTSDPSPSLQYSLGRVRVIREKSESVNRLFRNVTSRRKRVLAYRYKKSGEFDHSQRG